MARPRNGSTTNSLNTHWELRRRQCQQLVLGNNAIQGCAKRRFDCAVSQCQRARSNRVSDTSVKPVTQASSTRIPIQRCTTSMRRRTLAIPFDVDLDGQATINFERLDLKMRYDDGFVAYINGVEVLRRNAPGLEGVPPPFNADATASREGAGWRAWSRRSISRRQFRCSSPAAIYWPSKA